MAEYDAAWVSDGGTYENVSGSGSTWGEREWDLVISEGPRFKTVHLIFGGIQGCPERSSSKRDTKIKAESSTKDSLQQADNMIS